MTVPIVVTLLGLAAQWGTLGSDVRHLERRAATTEAELSRVSAAQSSATAQLAKVDATLDAMIRKLARLARVIEKLAETQHASR
jgi:septal ring factor EnvC (AmiA/AmiB activator)